MNRRAIVVTLCASTLACAPSVHRSASLFPAQAVQQRLLSFPQVCIAGFVANDDRDVDLNLETVRLLRTALTRRTNVSIAKAEPLKIATDTRFADSAFWRHHAEEHGCPLIVTGSIHLLQAPAKIEQRGRRTVVLGNSGRALDSTVVVIDGATGRIVSSERIRRRMQYAPAGRSSGSGLGLFLQMMDDSMLDWLTAISAARVIPQPANQSR